MVVFVARRYVIFRSANAGPLGRPNTLRQTSLGWSLNPTGTGSDLSTRHWGPEHGETVTGVRKTSWFSYCSCDHSVGGASVASELLHSVGEVETGQDGAVAVLAPRSLVLAKGRLWHGRLFSNMPSLGMAELPSRSRNQTSPWPQNADNNTRQMSSVPTSEGDASSRTSKLSGIRSREEEATYAANHVCGVCASCQPIV